MESSRPVAAAFEPRKHRSRNLILDAADAAFRDKGFAAVALEEIAQRAGLARMTIYNLFGAKEEIAMAIIARNGEKLLAAYGPRIAANEAALPLLEQAFLDSARWCLANRSIAPIALKGSPTPGSPMALDRPPFQRLIRDLMALGQAQGLIRCDKAPDILAAVLLGAYAQMMIFALAGSEFKEAWVGQLVRLLIEGFGARAPARSEPPRSKRRRGGGRKR